MSAPPEANSEYSRGSGLFGRIGARRSQGSPAPVLDRPTQASDADGEGRGAAAAAVLILALLGAVLVLIAQFTTLYQVHTAATSAAVKTVGTGSNHAWAPLVLALLAPVLAVVGYRQGSRTAFVALAVLGIVTLLIALLVDLPDAQSTGLIGSGASHYVQGTASPSAGLYMETLGAVLLLISGGVGFLLLSSPAHPELSAPAPTDPPADAPTSTEPSASESAEPSAPAHAQD